VTETVRFDGRVAIVTGAGRGLGREFALLLAQRGAAVVVNDVGRSADTDRYGGTASTLSEPADDVSREIEQLGGTALAAACDITDAGAVHTMVETTIEAFGQIDIIINNAGVVLSAPFGDQPLADLATCLDVHIRGAFTVSQAVWPRLQAQGYGRILNVCSSDGVLFGNRGMAAYDAAKAGVAGLTRGMAADGTSHGIHVNGLLPGARTRGNRSTGEDRKPGADVDMSPSLVAPAACWLVHAECPATGALFAASSGRMSRVFTGVGRGFQTVPANFSLEAVRDHWDAIASIDDYVVPVTVQEYNAFRTLSFRQAVASERSAREQ
jgi:NAD(P)-dependent dehydrogenase (short-subunit alcohol dehydrogenase family)